MKTAKEKRSKSKSTYEKLWKLKKMDIMKKRRRTSASVVPEKRSAVEEPEKKFRRKITNLDDEELWAEFETDGIDRMLRGEIKPKTLITTCHHLTDSSFPQRGPSIAEELVSVFPNSKYIRRGDHAQLYDVIECAKKNRCTSLVLAHTNHRGNDLIQIISLLNGAVAHFSLLNFTPPVGDITQLGNPVKKLPQILMENFTSPADVGTGRLIQSLFSKVIPSPGRSIARFRNHKGSIFFRHHRYYYPEEAPGTIVRAAARGWGLEFALKLKSVKRLSLDTGKLEWVCMPEEPWRPTI